MLDALNQRRSRLAERIRSGEESPRLRRSLAALDRRIGNADPAGEDPTADQVAADQVIPPDQVAADQLAADQQAAADGE